MPIALVCVYEMESKNNDQFDLSKIVSAGITQHLPQHKGKKVYKILIKEKMITVNKMKVEGKSKNEYYCKDCKLITKSLPYLKRHIDSKHQGLRFPCSICEYRAFYKHDLDNHMKAKHMEATFKCEKCDYSTHCKSNLTKHKAFRHEGKTFPCSECNFKAARKSSLRQHVKSIHENVKYNCSACDFSGTQQGDIIKHKNRVHLGIEFKCNECDYVGKENILLQRHVASKHEVAQKFKCKICSFRSNMKRNLQKHFEAIHKYKHKKYICNKCHKSFALSEYLKRHMKSFHTDKLIKCDNCDYKTKTNAMLKMHMEAIHDKVIYRCNLCEYKSGWRSHLAAHKAQNHTSTMNKSNCEICDYRTNNKNSMKFHQQSKHGNEKFNCERCVKSYTNQASLRRHVKLHHSFESEMKFGWLGKKMNIPEAAENVQCNICFKMFLGEEKMKVHKRKLHQGLVNCNICINVVFKSRTAFLQHKRSIHDKIRFKCNDCKYEATQKGDLKRHQIRMHQRHLNMEK